MTLRQPEIPSGGRNRPVSHQAPDQPHIAVARIFDTQETALSYRLLHLLVVSSPGTPSRALDRDGWPIPDIEDATAMRREFL